MIPRFADRVVAWQLRAGRHHLPWQTNRSPYRVWLSEVMLQQTQVGTAEGYFLRFLQRFPTVEALAEAPLDAVLAQWSGLGYYARARNVWRCAQQVVQRHGGVFPSDQASLEALSGIGRSTAGAIRALAFGQTAAILDGNVKRVLARHAGLADRLDTSTGLRQAWALAESRLPQAPEHIRPYTQGLMDLGSEICKPKKPACPACPLAEDCVGRLHGPEHYPAAKPRKLVVEQHWVMPYAWRLVSGQGRQLGLFPRPDRGIWSGLWCPQLLDPSDWAAVAAAVAARPGVCLGRLQAPVVHLLTHRRLVLQAVEVVLAPGVDEGGLQATGLDWPPTWHAAADWLAQGLPVPVRKHLATAGGDGGPAQGALL